MPKQRKWTLDQLNKAVKESSSVRQVLKKLGLIEAGGNYSQIKKYIAEFKINTKHFRGMAWSKGLVGIGKPRHSLEEVLVKDSSYQSFKLKKRLFEARIKTAECEECEWNKRSDDG